MDQKHRSELAFVQARCMFNGRAGWLKRVDAVRLVYFLLRVRTEDGGVARTTLDLCAGLAAGGHDVTLLTFDATDVPEAWKKGEPGCPRVEELPPINGPLKLVSRWARRRLEMVLKKADLL